MGAVLAQGAAQFDRFIKSPANGIIAVSAEQGVPLRRLLEAQLAAFDKQLDVSGPEVILDAAPALSFATLINELAVNAARYGALSVSAGKVSLHWTIDEKSDPSTLMFLWEETGGRRVVSRTRAGLDWTNIEALVRDLGKSRIDYASGGLKYELEVPLDKVRFHNKKGGSKMSLYRVVRLIGSSSTSWEEAAKAALEEAAKHLEDLRVAEVEQLDIRMQENKVVEYRARVRASFRYHPEKH